MLFFIKTHVKFEMLRSFFEILKKIYKKRKIKLKNFKWMQKKQ